MTYETAVAEIVAAAPPLSVETRARLCALLAPVTIVPERMNAPVVSPAAVSCTAR